MKTTNVICQECGKEFSKPTNEYNRSIKLGRRQFCSRSCGGKNNHSHLEVFHGSFNQNLKRFKPDEYSPFREFIRRAKNRDKRGLSKNVDITPQYLKLVWEQQVGICPYSKIELTLPKGRGNCRIKTASLDRIDSSKGYVEGNVQFVSMSINYLKSDLPHEKVLELIDLIKKS